MGWQPDTRTLPVEAVALQVTKAAFMVKTDAVEHGINLGLVADQTPGLAIADFPYHIDPLPLPARLLEHLCPPRPALSIAYPMPQRLRRLVVHAHPSGALHS